MCSSCTCVYADVHEHNAYEEARGGCQVSCSTTLPGSLETGSPLLNVELGWHQEVSACCSAAVVGVTLSYSAFHLDARDSKR